ncbi:MAG: SRPBCC domain-containing protein [Bacteroidota bacterium]
MTTPDFTTTILVDQTPEQVFNAINHPQDWWSGEITGSTDKLNDEFTYRYKEFHLSKQKIVEIIPGQKVMWLVIESSINYVEDKREWTDTKMSFEITEQDNKTQLRFTHLGLVPGIECFDSCSNSWTQLIQQSLFSLITTGKSRKIVLG